MPRTHSLVLYLATVLRYRTRVFGVDARPWFVVDVSLRVRRRVSRPGDAFRHCRRVLGAQCVSSSSSCSRPRIHVASCRVLVELRRTPSTPSPTHSCPSPSVPHVRHTMRLGGHGHHVLDGHGENRRIRPVALPLRWKLRCPDPKSLDAHRSCSLGLLGRTQEVQRARWKGADEDGSGFRARDRPLVFSFVWVCGNRTSSLDGFYRSFPKGKSIGWKKRTSLLRRRFVGGSWVRSRGETTVRRRPWRMADTDQADRQTDTNACERNTGHVDRHLDHRHPPCQDQAEDQDRTVRHRRGPWRLLTADHPPHLHQP